jgi:hypothetical protein
MTVLPPPPAHLKVEAPAFTSTSTIGARVEHFDLATVIKVSQAVSGEIILEQLIDTLLRMAANCGRPPTSPEAPSSASRCPRNRADPF